MAEQPTIQVPPGHVVTTTYGVLRHEFTSALMEMRSFCEKNGLTNIQWSTLPGALVEKARNEAARNLLRDPNAGWMLQVDGDMVFQPDALMRLLQFAYGEAPHADAAGAYCPLRGDLALPTIDTGSGTWESIFPGGGPVEVIRTGAAFILYKRHVFERLKDPWFRMRVPARPLDFMQEVDGFARQKFDGKNPFQGLPGQEWERLLKCAEEDPSAGGDFTPAEVGEDSALFDRMRFAGLRVFVHTDVVTGHVDTKVIDWTQHKAKMKEVERNQRLVAGLLD